TRTFRGVWQRTGELPIPPVAPNGAKMREMLRRLLKAFLALAVLAGTAGAAARLLLKSRGGPQSDEIDLVAVFEGIHMRSTASSFLGGKIFTLFGGVVLDLRR